MQEKSPWEELWSSECSDLWSRNTTSLRQSQRLGVRGINSLTLLSSISPIVHLPYQKPKIGMLVDTVVWDTVGASSTTPWHIPKWFLSISLYDYTGLATRAIPEVSMHTRSDPFSQLPRSFSSHTSHYKSRDSRKHTFLDSASLVPNRLPPKKAQSDFHTESLLLKLSLCLVIMLFNSPSYLPGWSRPGRYLHVWHLKEVLKL